MVEDLFGLLREGFGCVCGGRCEELTVYYSEGRDREFTFFVSAKDIMSGKVSGTINWIEKVYGESNYGDLVKVNDSYVFRAVEYEGMELIRKDVSLSEDDVEFIVEGVKRLRLCSPDLDFLLGVAVVLAEEVFGASVVAVSSEVFEFFRVGEGDCRTWVDGYGEGCRSRLRCYWGSDLLYAHAEIEAGDRSSVVSFMRWVKEGKKERVIASVNYHHFDKRVSVISDGMDLGPFYAVMRRRVEGRVDELRGLVKRVRDNIGLYVLFP